MALRAIFVDRDGTINKEIGIFGEPSKFQILPNAAEAIRIFREKDYLVIVITNQSGIARGIMTEDDLADVHERMKALLAEADTTVDAIYYCPHHPNGTVADFAKECDCRKPAPGLLLKGAEEFDIDLSQSVLIGDAPRDIEAGKRAGCRTIAVRSGVDNGDPLQWPKAARPDATATDLLDAANQL